MVTQFLEVNQKKELICVTLIILQEYLSGWLQVDIYDKIYWKCFGQYENLKTTVQEMKVYRFFMLLSCLFGLVLVYWVINVEPAVTLSYEVVFFSFVLN